MKNLIYLILSGALALASCSKDDPAPVEVGEIKLNKTTLTLAVGEEQPLTATVLPDNAENKTVAWSSSDTKIATVSDAGLVTAVAVGSTTITARAGGKSATCTVTVEPIAVESVTLDKTELTLKRGGTETLTATVLPEDAQDKAVAWSSSDEQVATVSVAGLVTAITAGTATITARAGDKSTTCAVIVEPNIYLTGNLPGKTAFLWKNGEMTTLQGLLYANHLFLSESTGIYVAGTAKEEQDQYASAGVWNDGKVTKLYGSNTSASSVFVYEGTVYAAGAAGGNTAYLWVDGAQSALAQSSKYSSSQMGRMLSLSGMIVLYLPASHSPPA